jgi:dolichol kinase
MFLGGFTFATAILAVYVLSGIFSGPLSAYLPGLFLIALAGTLVESLPLKDVDNLTVTLTAVLLGYAVFH